MHGELGAFGEMESCSMPGMKNQLCIECRTLDAMSKLTSSVEHHHAAVFVNPLRIPSPLSDTSDVSQSTTSVRSALVHALVDVFLHDLLFRP